MAKRRKFIRPSKYNLEEEIEEIIAKTKRADRKSRRIRSKHYVEIEKRFTHDFSYLDNLSEEEVEIKIQNINARLDDYLDRNYESESVNELSKNFTKNVKELFNIELEKDLTKQQLEEFTQLYPEFSSLTKPSPKSAQSGIDEETNPLLNEMLGSDYGVSRAIEFIGGKIIE